MASLWDFRGPHLHFVCDAYVSVHLGGNCLNKQSEAGVNPGFTLHKSTLKDFAAGLKAVGKTLMNYV